MDAGRMANAPNRLTARVEIPAACGGRKPNKVNEQYKPVDALDAMSGHVLWSAASADFSEVGVRNDSVTAVANLIIGPQYETLIALHERDGTEAWRVQFQRFPYLSMPGVRDGVLFVYLEDPIHVLWECSAADCRARRRHGRCLLAYRRASRARDGAVQRRGLLNIDALSRWLLPGDHALDSAARQWIPWNHLYQARREISTPWVRARAASRGMMRRGSPPSRNPLARRSPKRASRPGVRRAASPALSGFEVAALLWAATNEGGATGMHAARPL